MTLPSSVRIVGYGGPVIGATAVWLAPGDGTVPSSTEVTVAGYGGAPSGSEAPVWIAGYGGPVIGAVPVWFRGTGYGGGVTHSSQATAYLARTVGGNEGGNGENVAALIDGLVADGVWAKLDALYIFAQQNRTDAGLNLVSTSYNLPAGATFTAYQGLSAFPSPGGLNTGFNPALSPSPRYIQNDASLSVWVYSAPGSTVQLGTTANTGGSMFAVNFGGTWFGYMNDNSTGTSVTSPGLTGMFYCERHSGTGVDFYWNGVSKGTSAGASITPASLNMYVGGLGDSFSMVATLSVAAFGASLGSVGNLALYNRLRTYMTAVGVP